MLSKFVNQTTQLLLWLWSNKETCKYSFFVCCCFVCFGCGIYTICTINSPPLEFPVAVVLLCLRPQVQSLTQCKILHFGLALAPRTFTKCLDSIQMQARLAPAWISSLNTCLAHFKQDHHVSVSTCRRLLGLMATASPVLPLGLLHMRPFLWWMNISGVCSTGPATHLVRVSRSCA